MTSTVPSPNSPSQPLPSMTFSSLDAPPRDRFGTWCDLLRNTHAPMDLLSDHADDFRARQRVVSLGEVVVWPAVFPPVTFRRTAKLIRQSDPETYHLTLMLRGVGTVVRRGHELHAGPGIYHTNDSSRPIDIRSHTERGRIMMVGVEVPKAVLPLPRRSADRAIGIPMRDDQGVGALLANFLRQFVRDLDDYRLADASRLGAVVTDLVAATFAHAAESTDALPPHTHQYTTVLRIKGFIQQHLGDPALTPTVIAAAHNISCGHLHRLFRSEGVTVAALIRRARLERARTELCDPCRAGDHILTIAARCGLAAAELSRSFRTAYGMSPSEYRHLHQRNQPGGTG
ncbi:helix-turn-helix domain-containing protein [Streptomyces sp. NPDC020965]|uniref:AraC-like ligand-binding domain-containing protein n=1 Tax=Streptomyces sp. NPDC020965 TaxID=3365105 RepID=UPI0037B3039E